VNKMKNKILALTLIIALLSGIASAAVDFPEGDAGISAYVKAKSSINLTKVKPVLATIERETPDYIVGTVAMTGHNQYQYPSVYVSSDGWIVAYYPKDRETSWLLPWYYYNGGELTTTTLAEVIKTVANQIGGTTVGLKYYDYRYPNATKMMIIIESNDVDLTDYFKVTLPKNFTFYDITWSHLAYNYGEYYGESNVKVDGIVISSISCFLCQNYGSFTGNSEDFSIGTEHRIEISGGYLNRDRVALVLLYAET